MTWMTPMDHWDSIWLATAIWTTFCSVFYPSVFTTRHQRHCIICWTSRRKSLLTFLREGWLSKACVSLFAVWVWKVMHRSWQRVECSYDPSHEGQLGLPARSRAQGFVICVSLVGKTVTSLSHLKSMVWDPQHGCKRLDWSGHSQHHPRCCKFLLGWMVPMKHFGVLTFSTTFTVAWGSILHPVPFAFAWSWSIEPLMSHLMCSLKTSRTIVAEIEKALTTRRSRNPCWELRQVSVIAPMELGAKGTSHDWSWNGLVTTVHAMWSAKQRMFCTWNVLLMFALEVFVFCFWWGPSMWRVSVCRGVWTLTVP